MKTEQLIVQYLYTNKKVTLQDIGTFTISPEINIPAESDKDTTLPANAIHFDFDPKAGVDEGLIAYIVEHTRKIRPLAASDLESFVILNKQFLNIGKPLVFEGMGTLLKTQAGDYSFTQSGTSHFIHEDAPKMVTENYNDEVSWATPPKEKNNGSGKLLLIGIVAVLVIGAGIAAYYFINRNKGENTAVAEQAAKDTTATKVADTAVKPAPVVPVQHVPDTNSFYIAFTKTYKTEAAAVKAYETHTKYNSKIQLVTKDSLGFRLRVPFQSALADTLRAKDSVSRFYAVKADVELPH